MCRSRRELSNEYLLAKIGVDTAENEPLEVWGKFQFTIHFTPYEHRLLHAALRGRRGGEVRGACRLKRKQPLVSADRPIDVARGLECLCKSLPDL